MFIFLDESGDLGFDFNNLNTTKKFVITLLVCDNRAVVNQFSRAVLRAKKSKLRRSSWRFEELKGVLHHLRSKTIFSDIDLTRAGVYMRSFVTKNALTDI